MAASKVKLGELLAAVGTEGGSTVAIAARLGVNRGTAWRQLDRAEDLGYLESTPAGQFGAYWDLTERGLVELDVPRPPRCRDCERPAELRGAAVFRCTWCGSTWRACGLELSAAARVEQPHEQLGLAGVS